VRVVKTVGSHGPGPAPPREKGIDLHTGTSGQGPDPLGMLLGLPKAHGFRKTTLVCDTLATKSPMLHLFSKILKFLDV
jgi:hypothetical protein